MWIQIQDFLNNPTNNARIEIKPGEDTAHQSCVKYMEYGEKS